MSRIDPTAESLFEDQASIDVSKREYYRMLLDLYVLAPMRILVQDWRALIGAAVTLAYIAMGTIGVVVVQPPELLGGPKLAGFLEAGYVLGTDHQGRSLFAMMVHSSPAMLKMILSGAVFTTVVATIVGVYTGYKRGFVSKVGMTFTDIMLTIPGLPLIIVIGVVFSPRSPLIVGVVLSLNAWAGLARSIRSQVLTIREESYVEASHIMGLSTSTIMFKDIIPQLMPYISVNFMQNARRIIFASVGLYFLGVLPFSHQNWGVVLNNAYEGGALWQPSAIHWLLVPVVTITGFSFGLILLAQGTDRLFNPRVRARHAATVSEAEDQEEGEAVENVEQQTF